MWLPGNTAQGGRVLRVPGSLWQKEKRQSFLDWEHPRTSGVVGRGPESRGSLPTQVPSLSPTDWPRLRECFLLQVARPGAISSRKVPPAAPVCVRGGHQPRRPTLKLLLCGRRACGQRLSAFQFQQPHPSFLTLSSQDKGRKSCPPSTLWPHVISSFLILRRLSKTPLRC